MLKGKPKFDASADFTVSRGFTIAGIDFEPGNPFDKSLVRSDRVLEQLYNQRKLEQHPRMMGEIAAEPQPDPQPEVNDDRESLIAEYQILAGKKPHPSIKTETLRAKVAELR